MRILLIHQYYLEKDGAGISRFNQFVKYWTRAGHEVTVICGMIHYMTGTKPKEYRGKFITKEHDGTAEIVRVYVSDSYNKNFMGRMWGYVSFMLSACAALFTIKRHDVVITTSPPLHVGVPGIVASKLWNIPLVFEVRDLWPESAIEIGVLANKTLIKISYWLEALLYKHATCINVLTPAFKKILINKKNVPAEKIAYIPNGADIDLLVQTTDRDTMRKILNLHGKFVALYIGAHGIANCLDQILDAAHLLKNQSDIIFLLVGTGMKKQELIDRARTENLTNVRFMDPVRKDEIANILYASDVGLAVLKKIDIFKTVYPNKVFDYMVCAKPVVVAIDGAARELVKKAQAGIYVEPENPQALADAVNKLRTDADMRTTMGTNGNEFVVANFSREKLAHEYLDLLGRNDM
ncbi:MAG: glycosyltransferase family 4 protein [bacterium]|nr:glycosyltransferase family 4 protein [bacterium]